VRETFPDRILEEADEVVLVDLTPEALQERLRAGKVYPPERAEVALQNFFRLEKLSALRELALREVAEDVARVVMPMSSTRSVSSRWRSAYWCSSHPSRARSASSAAGGARRSGSVRSSTRCGCASPVRSWTRWRRSRSRRCAGSRSSWARTSSKKKETASWRPFAALSIERGSTYVFVGTPNESRRREILRGSLVSALVRELPGVDIRVVANRADRPESVT
jgi:Osmosensitive K+ channel histidine kinase